MQNFDPQQPLCVVSTHLDDAVLSCGHLLHANPGATVVTVCTDVNEDPRISVDLSPERLKEGRAEHVVRREEDLAALQLLRATPVWLGLSDSRFTNETRDHRPIVAALGAALGKLEPKCVVVPLGIVHSDHETVSEACLAIGTFGEAELYLYCDLPYALTSRYRGMDDTRLRVVAEAGIVVSGPLFVHPSSTTVKQAAFALYATQVKSLEVDQDGLASSMIADECYWRVNGTNVGTAGDNGGVTKP